MELLRQAIAMVPARTSVDDSSAADFDARMTVPSSLHKITSELERSDLEQWRDIEELMGGNVELARKCRTASSEAVRLWHELESSLESAREVRCAI